MAESEETPKVDRAVLLSQVRKVTSTAITNLARYESRLLADAVQRSLPRELRDEIARLCWENEFQKYDHYDVEQPWRAFAWEREEQSDDDDMYSGPLRSPLREKCLSSYHHPSTSFVNPQYVGEDAAREAVETFYRVAPAYLETLGEEEVADYFTDDNFAMGVRPRDHVTSITFFLSACMGRSDYHKGLKQPEARLLSDTALRAMVNPDRKKIPPITFFIWQTPLGEAIKVMELARALYYQLRFVGASIKVIFEAYEHSFDVRLGPIDLGNIMDLPRSRWVRYFVQEAKKQMGKNCSERGLEFWR